MLGHYFSVHVPGVYLVDWWITCVTTAAPLQLCVATAASFLSEPDGCIVLSSFIHPSLHPSIYSSIHLFIHPSLHPSLHPSISSSIPLFIHPSLYPSFSSSIPLFIHPSLHPSMSLLISLLPSIHPSLQPLDSIPPSSVRPSVCPSPVVAFFASVQFNFLNCPATLRPVQ